jgi:hypothetical protein
MKRGTLIIILVLIAFVMSYTITRCSEAQQIPQYGRSRVEVQIPTELFESTIKQMRVGDIGYCGASSMIVDVEGRAYLWGFTVLGKDMDLNYGWLKIERQTDGYYVSLKLGKQKWADGKPYYWSPYTIKVNSQLEELADLKSMLNRGSIVSVKKILIYRSRGWLRKDQVDVYEEKLPKEVCKK